MVLSIKGGKATIGVQSKIDADNLRLLRNLEQRNAIGLCPIRREVFTGGEYRRVMIEEA